jgi:hypothetical protein
MRPHPGADRTEQNRTEQKSKEFKRTVRSSSRVKEQFKGRSSSSSEGNCCCSLASLAGCLDQEEEFDQFVTRGIQGTINTNQKLLKNLIQVNYQCC